MTNFQERLLRIGRDKWIRKAIEYGALQVHDSYIFRNLEAYRRFYKWVMEQNA